jgi:hypothetical protein
MGAFEDKQRGSHCSQCSFKQLDALYQLNIEAKRYAESAEKAYSTGLKVNARFYSLRKKALYSLKQSILEVLVKDGCADTVRCHEIDGKEYYCVYIGEFSFHSPTDEWDEPPLDAPTSPTKTLESFDRNLDNHTDRLSEKEALKRLTSLFETPNNHLPVPFVERGYRSEFVGWTSLPGAIEEGDKVDGRFDRDISSPYDEFLFAVGDRFGTKKGECRILDRYRAWLTPYLDRSPLLPQPAYDVELADEVWETVRQRRIVDDWSILADSLDDPVPNVNGRQADMAGNGYDQPIDFDIGDIVELNPDWDEDGPYYCEIVGASLSYNLIMVDFEPVEPTNEAPLGLSIEEFADDVVAVYDTPPKIE